MTDDVFKKYYEKYKPLIKKMSYKNKVNGYTQEDIQQELLMILNTCIKNYDKEKGTKFITYFQSSCHYHIINLRKQNINYESLLKNPELIIDPDADTFAYVDNENFRKKLIKLLDEIKFGQYLKLYYLFGISATKIAKAERVSKQYIGQCMKEALDELRRKIKRIL